MINKKILIPLLIFFLLFSIVVLGTPNFVDIGPTTEFTGDAGVPVGGAYYIGNERLDLGVLSEWAFTHLEDQLFFGELAGIAGTPSATFQLEFGNDGAQIKNSAGELQARNAADDAYANFRALYLYGDGSNLTGIGASAATALTINAKEENTSAIVKGQAVYISGSTGAAFPNIGLADADDAAKTHCIGLAAEAITKNQQGLIRVSGLLSGVDSLGANDVNPAGQTWSAGDILYVYTTAGGLTNVKPTSGQIVRVGISLYGSSNIDAILIDTHPNPTYIAAAASEDIDIRMGDNAGSNKVIFEDFADNEVASINSDGKADFNELILDTALADEYIPDDITITETDPNVDEDSEIKAILVDEVTKTGDFTAGRMAIINNASGIIEQGTNTNTDVADAVTKKHAQNTDTQFDFYNALGSDHTWSGQTDTQLVGESVVLGDLLYFNWTDKEWKKTDADASATMPGLRIALETKSDGQTSLMLVKGYIRDDDWNFTGAMVYTSVTAGAMSSTAPVDAGDQLQRVGVAKSADILFFKPSIDVGEI